MVEALITLITRMISHPRAGYHMSYQLTPLAEAPVTLIARMIFRFDKNNHYSAVFLFCNISYIILINSFDMVEALITLITRMIFHPCVGYHMSYQITPLAEALITLIT